MGLIAKESGGGDFKRVPQGAYIARCFSLIDLGTQLTNGQYGEKLQHKIRIGFEILDSDEQGEPLTINIDGSESPMTISKSYTLSLHEKSSLRRDLSAWRGRDFTEEEALGFDISKLIGVYCMVNVTTSDSNGKTYSNIAGLTPLPGALKNNKPPAVHPNVIFDLDAPDMDVFNSFHDKLKEAITRSPEWAQTTGKQHVPSAGGSEFNDDVPF